MKKKKSLKESDKHSCQNSLNQLSSFEEYFQRCDRIPNNEIITAKIVEDFIICNRGKKNCLRGQNFIKEFDEGYTRNIHMKLG